MNPAATPAPGGRWPAIDTGLILAAFALLQTQHLVHYPIGLMALLGLYRAASQPRTLFGPGSAALLVVFGCIWLPMWLALPGAVNPDRALSTTLPYLHFAFAALYMVEALRAPFTRRWVGVGVIVLVGFWCLDALLQWGLGYDVFGYPYTAGILTGAFHPKQRLGLVVAVLLPPLLWLLTRQAQRQPAAWLALLPVVAVLMLSLKRAAWIMFMVSAALFLVWLWRSARLRALHVVAPLALTALCATAAIVFNPAVSDRVGSVAGLGSSDTAVVDAATGYRYTLWRNAWVMWRDNPWTGVGPRGYRHAYRDYAAADDFWLARGSTGQTHPHMMAMELLAETGLIGFVAFLAALALLFREFFRAVARDDPAAAWFAVAIVAWFPLNTHLAFYGSYWSSVAWLAVALAFGSAAAAAPGAARR